MPARLTDSFRLVGDYVVTPDEAGDTTVIAGGAVDVASDGRIAAVGTESDLGPTEAVVRRIGGLLMPGLVNSHAHTPMTLVRSAGDGLPLQSWLSEGVWPRERNMTHDDAYWGMLLGSAEMLLSGITSSCEMYLHDEATVSAIKSSGARTMVTPGIISALAPDGDIEGRLDEISQFHKDHHNPAARISVGFGPHSLYDLSPEQVGAVGERAQAVDALLHIHLEETATERNEVIGKWTGRTATEILFDQGVLEGRVLGAHGVWLSDSDQKLLGESGAGVAHCPVSNLKLGSGVAPVVDMMANGVTVGIGTDSVGSNDNLNLWEELKLAPLLARGVGLNAAAMTPSTALALGTSSAARAIGLDDVGSLAAGQWADIVRLDMDRPAFTPGIEADLLTNLVFACSADAVSDVWVGGSQVVADSSCATVDIENAKHQVRKRGHRLIDNSN